MRTSPVTVPSNKSAVVMEKCETEEEEERDKIRIFLLKMLQLTFNIERPIA